MPVTVGMLVDRDSSSRTVGAQELRAHGLAIVEAESVGEAYGLAQFGKLDLVIAKLPEDDAVTLCRRLRTSGVSADIPIVLVNDLDSRAAAIVRAFGATAVLQGRPSPAELLAAAGVSPRPQAPD